MWRVPCSQRYVWREAGGTFLLAAALVTGLLVVGGAATLARQAEGIGASAIGALVPLLALGGAIYALPLALLLAVTFTFSRLAADGELDAFRAAGIPARRLLPPVLLLGTLVTGALLVGTTHVAPRAHHRIHAAAKEALVAVLRDPPAGARTIGREDWRIHWADVEAGELCDLAILRAPDGHLKEVFAARRARMRYDEVTDELVLDVAAADVLRLDPEHGRRAGAEAARGVVPTAAGEAGARYGSEMHVDATAYEGLRITFRQKRRRGLPDLSLDELYGLHEAWQSDPACGLVLRFDNGRIKPWSDRQRHAELAKRYATPWAALCFVLVGAPIGCAVRRRSRLVAFAAGFLPVLVGYYPLLVLGETLAKARTGLPAELLFAVPHVALAALGVACIARWCWR